jgi:hypothetical protein
MTREVVLMRDLICQYHPEFVSSSDMRRCGIRRPDLFNVERLVEESLEAVGGYQFVDADHYDFDDYSDSKTGSVNFKTRRVEIGNVETKIGALRITVYNSHRDRLDYFFVPSRDLDFVRSPCYGNQSHKERIQFTWNHNKDHFNWFEDFRVSSFVELAQARDE